MSKLSSLASQNFSSRSRSPLYQLVNLSKCTRFLIVTAKSPTTYNVGRANKLDWLGFGIVSLRIWSKLNTIIIIVCFYICCKLWNSVSSKLNMQLEMSLKQYPFYSRGSMCSKASENKMFGHRIGHAFSTGILLKECILLILMQVTSDINTMTHTSTAITYSTCSARLVEIKKFLAAICSQILNFSQWHIVYLFSTLLHDTFQLFWVSLTTCSFLSATEVRRSMGLDNFLLPSV